MLTHYNMDDVRQSLLDAKAICQQKPEHELCFLIQANETLHAWAEANKLLEKIINIKDVSHFWELCSECGIELTENEKERIFKHLLGQLF